MISPRVAVGAGDMGVVWDVILTIHHQRIAEVKKEWSSHSTIFLHGVEGHRFTANGLVKIYD
jgi:pantothenate kinase type III